MPTLILADNFSHRDFSALRHNLGSANGERGFWSVIGNAAGLSFDTTKTRDGRGYMKIVEDGVTATRGVKGIAAGVRTLVGVVYFRIASLPSVLSRLCVGHGPTNGLRLEMNTTGNLVMSIGGTGTVTTSGTYDDDADHRLDFYWDATGTTHTVDWQVDGSAQTQVTRASQTAADITALTLGSDTASHTLTAWMQDVALSATAGDYPIGTVFVRALNPNGDGTHNISGAGDFDKGDGTDILASTSDAWGEVDDWIIGAADSTTYVQDTGGASTEYTEHTLGDVTPLETTIYDVFGYTATFAASTALVRLTVRIVDSAGTTLTDILADEDISDTAPHFNVSKISAPGGTWDQTELNGLKARIGLSTDIANSPRCTSVQVQYATPDVGGSPPVGESFPVRRAFVG